MSSNVLHEFLIDFFLLSMKHLTSGHVPKQMQEAGSNWGQQKKLHLNYFLLKSFRYRSTLAASGYITERFYVWFNCLYMGKNHSQINLLLFMLCIKTVEKKHKQNGDNAREMTECIFSCLSVTCLSVFDGWCPSDLWSVTPLALKLHWRVAHAHTHTPL